MTEVEGGLDEPAELEPEQGSLDLASPEDDHGRADWEKAAAAVLRKAGRLSDDDPDDAAWAKLGRTTLDGIAVSPLGTADLLDGLATGGRPQRAGDWDIRAHLDIADAKLANEAALVDLTNGVTSLWLEVEPDADFDTLLEGVLLDLAPVVLDVPADPVAAAEGLRHLRRRHRPRRRHQPRRRPVRGRAARWFETGASAPSSPPTTWSRSPSWPGRPGRSRSSSTRPPCTTWVRPTRRSSATRWPRARRTSGS